MKIKFVCPFCGRYAWMNQKKATFIHNNVKFYIVKGLGKARGVKQVEIEDETGVLWEWLKQKIQEFFTYWHAFINVNDFLNAKESISIFQEKGVDICDTEQLEVKRQGSVSEFQKLESGERQKWSGKQGTENQFVLRMAELLSVRDVLKSEGQKKGEWKSCLDQIGVKQISKTHLIGW